MRGITAHGIQGKQGKQGKQSIQAAISLVARKPVA